MQHAPRSALADPARLAAVRATGLLDAAPDPSLDRLARLAARLTGAPTAVVSLVVADRQVVLGAHGMPPAAAGARELPLSVPCATVVESGAPLALADVRERAGRASGGNATRFGVVAYLGVPLASHGQVLGTLCVADVARRDWSDEAAALLTDLADLAADVVGAARRRMDAPSPSTGDARFRALIEHAQDVVAVLALDGTILYESPSIERVLGYRPDEIVGLNAADLVHPVDLGPVGAALAGLVPTPGASTSLTYRCRHRDGSWRTLEAEGWNLTHEPAVGGVVVNARDVTERAAQEAALRESETRLRQAQRMEAVGQLAGGIAHDFNNLLTVIAGGTAFALESPGLDPAARAELAAVDEAAGRAARLTRQLLAFSRQQVLQPEVLDLNRVVAGVEPMLRRLIGEDIAILTIPGSSLRPVLADPGQLEQVLVNLAVNARDSMPDGGRLVIETANVDVTPEAAVRRGAGIAPGPYVRLTVHDTGVGMDEATVARVFEPFFTTKAPGKGTGLGLSTVYGIVVQSGGHVRVTSAPGQGATFSVDLPAAEPAATVAAPEAAPPAPAPRGRGETVLLVEDEVAVRRIVRRILSQSGYTVIEAADGRAALAAAAAHAAPIDLVLTDVVMPEMSGRAFAEQVGARHPGTRVLFMSGYTDDEMLRRGFLVPSSSFLQKPFTAERLLDAVRRTLGGPGAAPSPGGGPG